MGVESVVEFVGLGRADAEPTKVREAGCGLVIKDLVAEGT